ncbi:hypothetical protein BASA50_007189 [Batrachochytrium salamandrivorans]|uniref:Uncharacterized protein n=1 Tax=Batrachochytrium salamandrivorans TaxID=1357716 RepID=A0ABQ8F8W0_9FUNG|nr:hypothetical protein BASA60_011274 [Batrachochytrium salamandrivorans]KAH6593628.1 hypothetical protein BASA50_007189 [Batrachochytrium salamandrivorans]KAJ1328530.1 hypothetical protein BSLG_010262 [Batrachochytrium salamandrivorans]
MRVGTGIILSVLSSSVLAAVIPNYDSHGILLVRRAGSPNNNAVLWKRAGEEQRQIIPSKLESGAGAGSGNNLGSSKMGRFRDYINGLYTNLKTTLSSRQKKSIKEKDEQSVKNAVKKVAGVVQGESMDNFLREVEKYFRTTLEVSRIAFGIYDAPGTIPVFLLSIPNSSTQKSSTEAMTNMQNTGKEYTKETLGDVTRAVGDLIKRPQSVARELGIILESISTMCRKFELMYRKDYKALVLIVRRKNNEKHIKDTKKHISEMQKYRDGASESLKLIKKMLDSGRVTFKGKNPSKFDNFKSGFKSRLGIKSKSSNSESPNPESPDQRPSDQGESNQDTSNQGGIRPTPAPRLSKLNRQETSV